MTENEDTPPHYEIRIRGRLGTRWSAWLDGLTVIAGEDGTSVLRGPVVDQAALHGLLARLRDLGIELVALTRLDGHDPDNDHTTGAPS